MLFSYDAVAYLVRESYPFISAPFSSPAGFLLLFSWRSGNSQVSALQIRKDEQHSWMRNTGSASGFTCGLMKSFVTAEIRPGLGSQGGTNQPNGARGCNK